MLEKFAPAIFHKFEKISGFSCRPVIQIFPQVQYSSNKKCIKTHIAMAVRYGEEMLETFPRVTSVQIPIFINHHGIAVLGDAIICRTITEHVNLKSQKKKLSLNAIFI